MRPDVIIAGAGPVGLFLACELGHAGCSVVVLERSESADSFLKEPPFGIYPARDPTRIGARARERPGCAQQPPQVWPTNRYLVNQHTLY